MKLQIKYNFTDLKKALSIAEETAHYADIIEIGSLLIYKEGIRAVEAFCTTFPDKQIYVDAKITDQPEEAVQLYSSFGISYLSVVAEACPTTIKIACSVARSYNIQIILDCMNTQTIGQSVLDAKPLGAFGILMHQNPFIQTTSYINEEIAEIKANSNVPLFIKSKISEETIKQINQLNPFAIVISDSVTRATDPKKEAALIHHLIHN